MSNFLAIRNSGTYTTMLGTILNVISKQGNWGPQAECTCVDENPAGNETQMITVSLSKPPKVSMLPTINHIGQRLSFTVKAKQVGAKIYYNGFWNHTAQVNQNPPQFASPPQQAGQYPQQIPRPQHPQPQSERTGKDLDIIKMSYIKSASETLKGSQEATYLDIIEMAEIFLKWHLTGEKPADPTAPADEPGFPPN